jgi:hypothetical protein
VLATLELSTVWFLAGLLALAVLAAGGLAVRRILLGRHGGIVECGLRPGPDQRWRLGLAAYERVRHRQPKNEPGVSLFPVHVGKTLQTLRRRPGVRVVDAVPRYYPSQRWILRVPALREVATWNCLVMLERTAA